MREIVVAILLGAFLPPRVVQSIMLGLIKLVEFITMIAYGKKNNSYCLIKKVEKMKLRKIISALLLLAEYADDIYELVTEIIEALKERKKQDVN